MNNDYNLLLDTDSYKASHYLQYPPGIQRLSNYIEARGGEYSHTLFFGLQLFIKQRLLQPITLADIDEATEFFQQHGLPFNRLGWQHILKQHQGFLPLEISAVAEGTILPIRNALVQVINTDPACAWLPGYLETAILRATWYPTTVATLSWQCKQVIAEFLQETADNLEGLAYKLHDFGCRATTSYESACIGGAAHLVNFLGSDTVPGIRIANQFYNEAMAGFSIPAAEHSTITSWGKAHEVDAYRNMINQFGGEGKIFAVVSDSYDLWQAIEDFWGGTLRQQVIDNGGTLVIRPDSGLPMRIVPEVIGHLMAKFGYHTNSKGYHVLPPYLRVIQGDGMSPSMIRKVLSAMQAEQQSADNIAFGMGGDLLQKINRDTMSFAMKASAIEIDNTWRDIYKQPITDLGKGSKRGRLALVKEKNKFKTIHLNELNERENLLQPVYRDGQLLKDWTFTEIRARTEN